MTHPECALDAATGRILWQRALPAAVKAAPTVVDDTLVQPAANGDLLTLDARTGAITHVLNRHEGGYGPQNAAAIGATLFIGTNAGRLQALPLADLGIGPPGSRSGH